MMFNPGCVPGPLPHSPATHSGVAVTARAASQTTRPSQWRNETGNLARVLTETEHLTSSLDHLGSLPPHVSSAAMAVVPQRTNE